MFALIDMCDRKGTRAARILCFKDERLRIYTPKAKRGHGGAPVVTEIVTAVILINRVRTYLLAFHNSYTPVWHYIDHVDVRSFVLKIITNCSAMEINRASLTLG